MSRPSTAERRRGASREGLAGGLFGVAVAAAVDEIVFHQLLQWHHFYDGSSSAAGIVSDGILHALSWTATVVALFLLVDLGRRSDVDWRRWWAFTLIGAGGFQLYDGLVQHKLLGLHQVRYDVDLVPYDLAWNGIGAALLIGGLILAAGTKRMPRARARADA